HDAPDPRRAIAEASAFFVGGGNTFRLLKTLEELRIRDALPAVGLREPF
ncbi:MAG: Type 1 glutamine amidotransferase-like domain-containing protein, partial [Acidobacteriota bacterium]